MNVLMTIFTINPDTSEVPGCLFLVTIGTRDSQMGAMKGKGADIVLFLSK
jgi:hypothetical protein